MVLKGHSGCELSFVSQTAIRKVSASVDYNSRLLSQAKKQDSFITSNGIRAPKVLGINTDSELYFFDMEYIRADTFASFLRNEDFTLVKREFAKLLGFVRDSFDSCEVRLDVTDQLYHKTKSLKINVDMSVVSFLKKIESSTLYAPIGYCHGDLTFENILIDKELFFIDFLDSFLDTPLIDLAKIAQEFNVYWSFRNVDCIDGILVSKVDSLHKIFVSFVNELNEGDRITFRYLEILNLLRILPYTEDIRTYMLLKKSIYKLNQFL